VVKKKVVKLSTELKVLKSSNSTLQLRLTEQQEALAKEKIDKAERVERASSQKKLRVSSSATRKPEKPKKDIKKSSGCHKLTQTNDNAFVAVSHLSWDLEGIFFKEFPPRDYN